MPILGDLLSSDTIIWAHPTYGIIGPKDRACAWGRENIARRIEREARPDHDMLLNIGVGRPLPTLPRELNGSLIDIATVVPRLMRTEEIIGQERYQEWLRPWKGKQWPWGLPIVRAWSFDSYPAADDILPTLRAERFNYYHPEQMTTRLTAAEIESLRPLAVTPIIFDFPIADESGLAAQRQASQRVRSWASRLAAVVAGRCRGARPGYVVLRPGYETNETDLDLLIGKLFQDQHERCALCGGILDMSDSPNRMAQPSADRIDSTIKVYDRTNLQIAHLACNLGKNECPNIEALEFFRTWCGEGIPEDFSLEVDTPSGSGLGAPHISPKDVP
jgi:hypothetical protein